MMAHEMDKYFKPIKYVYIMLYFGIKSLPKACVCVKCALNSMPAPQPLPHYAI